MSARKKFTNFKDYLTEFKLDTLNKLDKRFDPIHHKKQILKTFQFTEKDTNINFELADKYTNYKKTNQNDNDIDNTNSIQSNENSTLEIKRYDRYGFEMDSDELDADEPGGNNTGGVSQNCLNHNPSNSNDFKNEMNDILYHNPNLNSISFTNFKKLNPCLESFDASYMVVDDDERKNQGTLLLELNDNLVNEIENLLYQASNNQEFENITIAEGQYDDDDDDYDTELAVDVNLENTVSKKSVRFNESDDSEASTLKTVIAIDDCFNNRDDLGDGYELDSGMVQVKDFMKSDNFSLLQTLELTDDEYSTERKRDKFLKLIFNYDNDNSIYCNNKIEVNKDIDDLFKYNSMQLIPIDLQLINKDSNKLNLIQHEEIQNVIIIPMVEKLKLYLNNNIDTKDIIFNSRKIGDDWCLYSSWSIWKEIKNKSNNNKYISTYENIMNFSTFNEMNQSLDKCELIFEKKISKFYSTNNIRNGNNSKRHKFNIFKKLEIDKHLVNNENYYILKHGLNPNKKHKPFNNKNLYSIKLNINSRFFSKFFKKLSKLIINYENYNLKFINAYEALSAFQIKFKSLEIEFRLLITKEIYINRVHIIINELLQNLSDELVNCINSILIVKNDIVEEKLYKPFKFY